MSRKLRQALRRLWPAAILLAAGCSKQMPFNEKVEGTVKLNGAPLAQVMVEFIPDEDAGPGAPTAIGLTDGNGHFQLTHDRNRPGAALGKHHVILVQGRSADPGRDAQTDAVAAPLPPIYTNAAKTPLKATITEGQHTYDLAAYSQFAPAGGGEGRGD